jgi:hypothetical protein
VLSFAEQMGQANYLYTNSMLQQSTDWQAVLPAHVVDEMRYWGSTKFADWLANRPVSTAAVPVGIHQGWHDFRRSVNVKTAQSLNASGSNSAAALRALNRARKVRLR